MSEKLCVGDCMKLDEEGRITVVPDESTIVCEDDGSGGTHLVAKTIDCDPWPYRCTTSEMGNRVYCEDGLLYTLKPYSRYGTGGDFRLLPEITTLLSSPVGTVIREARAVITNTDPCCRDLCVIVNFNFSKNQIWVPPGGTFEVDYAVSTDGESGIKIIYDEIHRNTQNPADNATTNPNDVIPLDLVDRHHSGGTSNWTERFSLACGESREIIMRIQLAAEHTPGVNWNIGNNAVSFYGMYFDYLMVSDCENWNLAL